MSNDLVPSVDLLLSLPGAPFQQEELDAAVAAVRGAAQWHIAPQRTETVVLDVVVGEPRLRLPTRHLVEVTEIRNADTAAVFDPSLYRVSRDKGQVMKRSGFWPAGFESVEVDLTHGYDSVPLDLLAVVAEAASLARRDQSVSAIQIDDFQQQFRTVADAGMLTTQATFNRYARTGDPLFGIGVA